MNHLMVLLITGIDSLVHRIINGSAQPSASAVVTAAPAAASSAASTPTPNGEEDARLSDTNSILLIANKKHKLPDGYVPSDLVEITSVPKQDRQEMMRREAADALVAMFDAASQQGVQLYLTSAYRSYDYQVELYNGYVAENGQAYADSISSRPGYSDHQTGLACDLGQTDMADMLDQNFIETDAGQWLYAHAHEYGFILRYPQGKEAITGYDYEPWHYRYVGVDTATAMYNISPDETMEEYFHIEGGDYAS
jgi:LAS superfamily LD-carboxypeptidase LdcB